MWVSQTSQWQPDSPIVDVTDLIPRALSVPKLIGTDLAVPGDTKLTSQLDNPPSTQRPMAIAATGWSDSIRVYTQSGDGFIREASYDLHTTPWDQDLATRLGKIFSQADLELRHIHGWQRSRSQFTHLSAVLIPSMQVRFRNPVHLGAPCAVSP